MGAWFQVPSAPTSPLGLLDIVGPSTTGYLTQVRLELGTDLKLRVVRGNASGAADTVLATATSACPTGQKVYVELYVQLNDSTGRIHVARNGANEPGLSTGANLGISGDLTGLDTNNGSATSGSNLTGRFYWGSRLGGSGLSGTWTMGGFYLMISGTSWNNTIIGNPEPILVALTADGSQIQSAAFSGAASRWQALSEIPHDGDTSTVTWSGGTSGPYDLYAHAALPGGISYVLAAQVSAIAKTSASINVISAQKYSGTAATAVQGFNSVLHAALLSQWNNYPGQVSTTVGAWSTTIFNASEFGIGRFGTTQSLTATQLVLEVLAPYTAALAEDPLLIAAGQHWPRG
jgi:hypothetical protein